MKKWDDLTDPRLELWYKDWIHLPAGGGESYENQCRRVAQFLDELRHSGHTDACIFTHRGVIACAMVYAGICPVEESFSIEVDYGSKNVLELHGSVHRNYCRKCGKLYDAQYIKNSAGVPMCSCGGQIKPDVVLYEEGLDSSTMQAAIRAISQAEVLIIGGTSLAVYPAAGLIDYYRGNKLVLINKSATPLDSRADLVIQAPIGEVFSAVC